MLSSALRNGHIFLIFSFIEWFCIVSWTLWLCSVDSGSFIVLWEILGPFIFRLRAVSPPVGSGSDITTVLESGLGLFHTGTARGEPGPVQVHTQHDELSLALPLPRAPLPASPGQKVRVFIRVRYLCGHHTGVGPWLGSAQCKAVEGRHGATHPGPLLLQVFLPLQFSYFCVLFRIFRCLFFGVLSRVFSYNQLK